jgi:hypothetical protein
MPSKPKPKPKKKQVRRSDGRSPHGAITGKLNKVGRPTKLTPEIHAIIVNAIAEGNYIETAAACAGISKETLHSWLRRGARSETGIHRRFADDVNKATAKSEQEGIRNIRGAAARDAKHWTAEAWYMERRFGDRWSRKDRTKLEVSGPDGKPIQVIKIGDDEIEF